MSERCARARATYVGKFPVAYPQHLLVAFGGTLPSNEIWQCGIRGLPQASASYGDRQDIADRIAPNLVDWFSTAANRMNNLASLTFVKVNEIAPDGSYVGNPVTVDTAVTPGGRTSSVPNILSLCFSWTTAMKRGLAHTGRIYPPFAFDVQQGMAVTQSVQTDAVASAQNLLDAIADNASSFGVAPYVVSAQGALHAVNGVRIGSIIDVQRRRKNALVESYETGDWPI